MRLDNAAAQFVTTSGIIIHRFAEQVEDATLAVEELAHALDHQRGVLLSSSYEYPGRYSRWDLGFTSPPIAVVARGRRIDLLALNERGSILLPALHAALVDAEHVTNIERKGSGYTIEVAAPDTLFPEELRSKQPTVFSVLRALIGTLKCDEPNLGLFGAFGYDLAFQFESVQLHHERRAGHRDLVLYLPDHLLVVDHRKQTAVRYNYEFDFADQTTRGVRRDKQLEGLRCNDRGLERGWDHRPGEYAKNVELAKSAFRCGDLFEVVLSQTSRESCTKTPSALFKRLKLENPAPFNFIANLGESEHLIGASPEMYVRVDGDRVETCPIAGTVARGTDALEDAERIRELLSSAKEEAELTMCTDVDRNDKSRVCDPESIHVIGRRQIELYSRVIHTVDHVQGRLRPGYDGLDAFLTHAWAVTVTGAPKTWAMQFIEQHEKSPRNWYGGAVGVLRFDGGVNTALTLRTIRLVSGVAEVRAGATLLYDSDPDAEERETQLKARALLDVVCSPSNGKPDDAPRSRAVRGEIQPRVLLIDHDDSFVHTLAGYLRRSGAKVTTLRAGFPLEALETLDPDLVVLSPGPGSPSDFPIAAVIKASVDRGVGVFGVCLGLQGIVEFFGGKLATLEYPMHGKRSQIRVLGGRLFEGLPTEFSAGRYHSLYAVRESLPGELLETAESEDGIVMAVEHRKLPLAAVQFHPESILTLGSNLGSRVLSSALLQFARR